tara:strand:- start:548 stop:775 length:228 start_codon:yes stop_codon:yes gene_type:complete
MVNNHWYYKGRASEYDSFDLTDYVTPVRWNHDNTEWLAEHSSEPSDKSDHLTSEAIKLFIMGAGWGYDEEGNQLT